MKVLVAGATGAVGRPLIAKLVHAGHEVTGLVRDDNGASLMRELGAAAEIADALDAAQVDTAVKRCAPEVVINQLTRLPKRYTPESMQAAVPGDHKLRREGGANLQAAAARAGARRYILQSCAFWYEPGEGLADESASLAVNTTPYISAGSRFYQELEQAALAMKGPEVIFLRYAFLYGPGTWYTADGDVAEQLRQRQFPIIGNGEGVWSWVHVDDAAEAAVLALTAGTPGAYNIVDDDSSPLSVWLPAFANAVGAPEPPRIPLEQVSDPDLIYYATKSRGATNAKAKRDLRFRPQRLEWLQAGSSFASA